MNTYEWEKIKETLKKHINLNRFDTWIKPLNCVENKSENTLTLSVPSPFFIDFLNQNYKENILSTIKNIFPKCNNVLFINKKEHGLDNIESSIKKPILLNKKVHNNSLFNYKYNFDLFITGPGNELAKSVSFAVAENPGKTKFNPLLIYGGVGLGKTHLLNAIGNYILINNPDLNIIFSTLEEFYINFIDAIKNGSTRNFTDKFRQADILLIDDIQFLSGKDRTQEEFFYIFNTLYQKEKQIILTSDLPPSNIKGIHDRLLSRFQWGLCVDIQPPDLETRVAILKKKAEKDNLNIPENIIYYIAENISSNIRTLEGVIIRLLAFASITNSDITINLVKTILNDNIKKNNKLKFTIDDIIEKCALYYSIPENNLREKNRSKEVAHCRQIAMYMTKKYTNYSLKTIGLHFGGRDHSTVIHAIKKIDTIINKDYLIKKDINYILNSLDN